MPGRDGTGPMGQGALTGRGLGKCLAVGIPAVAGAVAAFGFGRRKGFGGGFARGFGKGLGWRAFSSQEEQDELSILKSQAEALKENLDAIQGRIAKLENK